jgi:NifU-like protein involved in Fe-S cluster formation
MPADTDLMKLYSNRILALAAQVPSQTPLAQADAVVKKRAPLCGSTVSVELSIDQNGKIQEFTQDVKACALGQAAAAVVAKAAKGQDLQTILRARDQLRAMLRENGTAPIAPFEGFEALVPAKEYKNRHASILLSIEATAEAMEIALMP